MKPPKGVRVRACPIQPYRMSNEEEIEAENNTKVASLKSLADLNQ